MVKTVPILKRFPECKQGSSTYTFFCLWYSCPRSGSLLSPKYLSSHLPLLPHCTLATLSPVYFTTSQSKSLKVKIGWYHSSASHLPTISPHKYKDIPSTLPWPPELCLWHSLVSFLASSLTSLPFLTLLLTYPSAFCFWNLVCLLLKAWSWDLGACSKCRASGFPPDLLDQNLHFNQSSPGSLCILTLEKHCPTNPPNSFLS